MTTSVYNVTCSTALGASRADLSTESSVGQPRRGRSCYRCSPVLVRGLLAATAVAVTSGCELFAEPHDLDTDVVVLSLLLESGERTAEMVASHPHRERDEAPPDISATLEGSGWTAEFTGTGEWECGDRRHFGASTCLGASLPEAVVPGRYRVRGTTPLGPFTGEATVPGMPSPTADTLRVPVPDTAELVFIPLEYLEYQVDSATAALLVDIRRDLRSGVSWSLFSELGDSLPWHYPWEERDLAIDLRARAVGRNYTDWFRRTGGELLLPPWPSFGIEGEGAYGYFDGISPPSGWVHIVGEPE